MSESSPRRIPQGNCTILYTTGDYKLLDIFVAIGKHHFTSPSFNLTDLCLGFRLWTGATTHTGGRAGAKSQTLSPMAGCLQGARTSTSTMSLELQPSCLPWNQKPSRPQRCQRSCSKPETQNAWLLEIQKENLKALETLRNSRDGLSGLAVFHVQKDINQPEPPPWLPTADEGV